MNSERRAILSLLALGRITPRDAERLLAAWNSGREELWAIVVCAGTCIAQSLPELARLAHALLPGLVHAASAVMYSIGGML